MNKKIYEIEFFRNFYGSLNAVDWGKMNYGANDAGTCLRKHSLNQPKASMKSATWNFEKNLVWTSLERW